MKVIFCGLNICVKKKREGRKLTSFSLQVQRAKLSKKGHGMSMNTNSVKRGQLAVALDESVSSVNRERNIFPRISVEAGAIKTCGANSSYANIDKAYDIVLSEHSCIAQYTPHRVCEYGFTSNSHYRYIRYLSKLCCLS